jgi:hypothetical protein
MKSHSFFVNLHGLKSRCQPTLLKAVVQVIAACIGGWFLLQRHNEGLVAQTALLDSRNRSLPRGTELNPPEPPLALNRAARNWNIYLPLGSTEGT